MSSVVQSNLRNYRSFSENNLWEKHWFSLNQDFTMLFIHITSLEKCSLYQNTIWFTDISFRLSTVSESQELYRQVNHPFNITMSFNNQQSQVRKIFLLHGMTVHRRLIFHMEETHTLSVTVLRSAGSVTCAGVPWNCPLQMRILFEGFYLKTIK